MANEFNARATGPTQRFYIPCEVIDDNLRRVTNHNSYLQGVLETRDSECDAFRENISHLKSSLASLQEKLSQNDQKVKDLLSEINTLKANSALIARHNEYLERNNFVAKSNAKLCTHNNKLSKEVDTLKRSVTGEKDNYAELQRRYQFLEQINNNLIEHIKVVKQNAETEQEKGKTLEEKLARLESCFKEKEEGLQRCLREANDEILQINCKFNVLSRENKLLIRENEKLAQKIKNFEREKDIEALQNNQVGEWNEKLELANVALQNTERHNQNGQEELENANIAFNEKIKGLEGTINAQREEIHELEKQLTSSGSLNKVTVEELQRNLWEARPQIAELNSNLKLSLNENNFLAFENKRLLKKVEKLKSERDKLESEIQYLNVKHQDEIRCLTEQLNETVAEFQKLEENNKLLQKELNQVVIQKPMQFNDQSLRLTRKSNGRRVRMLLSEVQELVIAKNATQNEQNFGMGQNEEMQGMQPASQENGQSSSKNVPKSTIPTVILTRVDEMNWAASSDKNAGVYDTSTGIQLHKPNEVVILH